MSVYMGEGILSLLVLPSYKSHLSDPTKKSLILFSSGDGGGSLDNMLALFRQENDALSG